MTPANGICWRPLLLTGLLLAALLPLPLVAQDSASIIHWNDFHGQVRPLTRSSGERQGGIRAISHYVDTVREEIGADRTLVLDAGDCYFGSAESRVFRGRLVVDLWNAIGVTAGSVGNHELDHGMGNLVELAARAEYPLLAANLVDEKGVTRSHVRPWQVLNAGGISFGVIGLITPETVSILHKSVREGVHVANPAEACRKAIGELRAAGAECLVVLSHLGLKGDKELARTVPGIHLIIGGHSHVLLETALRTPEGVVIAQAGEKGKSVGRLDVVRGAAGEFRISGGARPLVARSEPVSERVETILAACLPQVDAEMNVQVGVLREPLLAPIRGAMPSSSLGNWLAEIFAREAGVSIGLHNRGGIRADLLAGPVTLRQLFEVSPFGNGIVVCELTGADLEDVMRESVADDSGRLESYGLTCSWRQGELHPELVELLIAGEPVDPAATYRVATNDYIAYGGDDYEQFQRHGLPVSAGKQVFEASVETLRSGAPVIANSDNHFPEVESDSAVEVREVGASILERAASLLGLLTMLGIAFAFSTRHSAVKIRTVLWGVGLQLLFATIILASPQWSLGAMFVLLALVVTYCAEGLFPAAAKRRLLLALSTILICAAGAYLFSALHASGVTSWVLGLTAAAWFGGILLKNRPFTLGSFVLLIVAGFACLYSEGVHGGPAFEFLAGKVKAFLGLTLVGSDFLFGNLAHEEHFFPGSGSWPGFGFQFAFAILPTIIFFSAFMSILYYLGVVQVVIGAMARFMRWSMQTSGSETVSCSANVFVGQTEAPFLVKPFLKEMTSSELHAIMVGGFATIAGGVLAAYIQLGIDPTHLIAASVMSAPAALVIAKLLVPETEHSVTAGDVEIPTVKVADNIVGAASNGVTDGLKLALNVGAMLIGFICLIAFVDVLLGWMDGIVDGRLLSGELIEDPIRKTQEYAGIFPGSLKTLFGFVFRPLAFVMGVSWAEAGDVGYMMGTKIGANEFVAYGILGSYASEGLLSRRAIVISTYALCGFANFASIGIQIGGIGAICPERKADLARLGVRAMFGGALASWMTASVAGMMIWE